MVPDLTALKLAAIDAYMMAPINQGAWIRREHDYVQPNLGSGSCKVERPVGGRPGGVFTIESGTPSDDDISGVRAREREMTAWFTNEFNEIRRQVDDVFAPFEKLPKPDGFPIDEVVRWIDALSTGDDRERNSDSTGRVGDLTGVYGFLWSIDRIDASDLSGGMMTTFKENFLGKLRIAIRAYDDLAVVLLAGLCGEKELWTRTQSMVDELVANATTAFDACGHGYLPSWKFDVDIAKAMVTGVAAAVGTGGVAIALGLAGAALQVVQAYGDEAARYTDQGPAPDFKSVMAALVETAEAIEGAVWQQEELLRDSLSESRKAASGPSWNLDNMLWGTNDATRVDNAADLDRGPDELTYNPSVARELCTTMTHFGDHVEQVARRVRNQDDGDPWERDAFLGLSHNGCFWEWDDLRQTLRSHLSDLAWELHNAAKTLRTAFDALEAADEAARDRINRALNELAVAGEGGSGEDPGHDYAADRSSWDKWTRLERG